MAETSPVKPNPVIIAQVDLGYLAGLVEIAKESGCIALTVGDVAIAFQPKKTGSIANAIGFSAHSEDDEDEDDTDDFYAKTTKEPVIRKNPFGLYSHPKLFPGGRPPSFAAPVKTNRAA